jgi:hypothetical protein
VTGLDLFRVDAPPFHSAAAEPGLPARVAPAGRTAIANEVFVSARLSDSRAALQVAAILLIAIALVPAGSHLASLVSKMRLSPDQYMIAQRAYDAWSLFGIAVFGALLATLWHAYLARGNRRAALLSLLSFFLLGASQVVFWIYTYPMNVASRNWTVLPEQFENVRTQLEYSHAASAIIVFAALVAMLCAALADRPGQASPLV